MNQLTTMSLGSVATAPGRVKEYCTREESQNGHTEWNVPAFLIRRLVESLARSEALVGVRPFPGAATRAAQRAPAPAQPRLILHTAAADDGDSPFRLGLRRLAHLCGHGASGTARARLKVEKSVVSRRRLPWTRSEPGKSCVRRFLATLFLASMLLMSPGCRTFNTTEEEFQKQQQGVYDESPNEEAVWWCLGELLRLLGPCLSGK